ncbi:MAG: GNAT family N-acetyltransferase [Gammaproteobacteria bacterium]|nr:GNAT family N-acetyltransferase [Gammaproteobacteria bacterium]
MDLVLLAEREDAIPKVANWYFDEWGYLGKDSDPEGVAKKIRKFLNRDKIPLMVIAIEKGEVIGAAQLKYREMDIYPEKEHWLGGVYVAAAHRNKGIGAQLVGEIVEIARRLDVSTLHLQTERLDGGLYGSLGWAPIEKVNYHGVDVLVMGSDIGA